MDLKRRGPEIRGIVFDKDGTLIDFRGTWDSYAAALIDELTDDPSSAERLAAAMVFDLQRGTFLAESPIIAGTAREAADCVASGLIDADPVEIEQLMALRAAQAAMSPVVPLGPLCDRFLAAGMVLGVATNDSEDVANANLETLGIRERFAFVAGYDSGFGGKPGPGMVTGFCEAIGLSPEKCIMVGDSPHDLIAAQRAGVRGVGVLTGTCDAQELAPLCEVVLPDIGHLPKWLAMRGA